MPWWQNPYMLTFTGLAKEDTEGLPATAFAGAAPKKARPVTRKK